MKVLLKTLREVLEIYPDSYIYDEGHLRMNGGKIRSERLQYLGKIIELDVEGKFKGTKVKEYLYTKVKPPTAYTYVSNDGEIRYFTKDDMVVNIYTKRESSLDIKVGE